MSLFRKWVPILVATITGIAVLLGYFLPGNLAMVLVSSTLVEWAVIVAAFAFLIGLANVIRSHGDRLLHAGKGWLYSLILLVAVVVGLLISATGAETALTQSVFTMIIKPLGASLAALILFTLVAAAFRLLRARRDFGSLVFLVVVLLVLVGSVPFLGLGSLLLGVREFVVQVLGMAGMRGLLIGVALGTVITALRVLLVGDWPHGESS